MKLFVYGTLKRNYSANHLLQEGRLLALNTTIKGYKMYRNGWYPMVVKGSENDTVLGEIWDIPDHLVDTLDTYEGHPTLFKRIVDKEHDVSLYLFNNPVREEDYVASGVFE